MEKADEGSLGEEDSEAGEILGEIQRQVHVDFSTLTSRKELMGRYQVKHFEKIKKRPRESKTI